MKNHIKFIAIMLLIIGLITISCSKDDKNEVNNSVLLSNVQKNDNYNVSDYNNSISLSGNMKGWLNKNNEYVIYTETEDYKHIFVLQEAEKLKLEDTKYSDITFLEHGFIAKTASGKSHIFKISGKNESQNLMTTFFDIAKTKQVETTDGMGIVHIWLSKKDENNKLTNYNTLANIDSVFERFASCDSGGPGSSSCTTNNGGSNGGGGSSCSVSCGTGYFACCNNGGLLSSASCKCKPDA